MQPGDHAELLASTAVSRTWRLTIAGRVAALRVDRPGVAAQLGLDRHREPSVLRAVATAGLGPACLVAHPDSGLLLTGWLPGRAWTARDLQQPESQARAAGLLRQVHALPCAAKPVDLASAIDTYARLAGPACAALAAEARVRLGEALHCAAGPLCLCHNDPSPANFIEDDRPGGALRLVDWEYAAPNVAWFDLAALAAEARLDPAQSAALHAAYLGRPPVTRELAAARAWSRCYTALAGLWAAALDALG